MTSTFYYSAISFTSRFLSQRSYDNISVGLTVSLITSLNGTRNLEDMLLLNSFRHMELLSGSKPFLAYFGSRYVGTSKRSFSLLKVDLRAYSAYIFLESLVTLFLPNFQKRVGRIPSISPVASMLAINCRDLQFFTGYSPAFSCDPLTIKVGFSHPSSKKSFVDFLYIYKFNFAQ